MKNNNYSQCKQIARWLKQGYTLTAIEAFNLFGCMRLASRIHDLKNKGLKIESRKILTVTGKTVTQYKLAE